MLAAAKKIFFPNPFACSKRLKSGRLAPHLKQLSAPCGGFEGNFIE
jgi:hypothetical protein